MIYGVRWNMKSILPFYNNNANNFNLLDGLRPSVLGRGCVFRNWNWETRSHGVVGFEIKIEKDEVIVIVIGYPIPSLLNLAASLCNEVVNTFVFRFFKQTWSLCLLVTQTFCFSLKQKQSSTFILLLMKIISIAVLKNKMVYLSY